jgi:uncharacterized protein YqeY
MSEIRTRLMDDVKKAMIAKDKEKLAVVRMIQAELKQFEIDNRDAVLDDQKAVDIMASMIKTRRQSIKQYEAAQRPDMMASEEAEITIIEQYLPERMSDEQLLELIKAASSELGASSVKDIGRVANYLREQVRGQVETSHLNFLIKTYLTA